MAKKLFELVFFMCLISNLLYANDIALVTDLTGEISASCLEPETGVEPVNSEDRGRLDWQVELAEMLSSGTNIKTGQKASLTLIHLANNVEYVLGADSQAFITDEGVEGQDVSSEAVRLVSTSLGLDGTMQHQVGAVVVDHQIVREFALDKNSEVISASEKSALRTPAAPLTQSASTRSRTAIALTLEPVSEFPISSRSSKPADSMLDLESEEQREEITVAFALPKETFDQLSSSEQILQSEGYDIKLVEAYGGWVNIHFTAPAAGKDFELNVAGDKGYARITLHVEGKEEVSSIAQAWRLEKSGLLAQAASIWLAMEAEGMSAKKIAVHLKRIKNKLRS